jgi:hypothetical protein
MDKGKLVSVTILIFAMGMGITAVILKDENQKMKLEIENKQNLIDSLHDENFNSSTELGRYELTLDHLKEVNPKLGKEMEEWMNHETE